MELEKNTYYIGLANGEISRSSTDSPWNFKIEATDDEITELRHIFDSNYGNEWAGFWRAHVPIEEYHHDQSNDQYDEQLINAYKMIYKLGDNDTKKHIDSIGILKDFTID